MALQHSMAPDLGSARIPKVSSSAPRLVYTPLPAVRVPQQSLHQRLVRFLMFVYGPADIGPLGPPFKPRAWEAAAGVLTPQRQGQQGIRIIPVP